MFFLSFTRQLLFGSRAICQAPTMMTDDLSPVGIVVTVSAIDKAFALNHAVVAFAYGVA